MLSDVLGSLLACLCTCSLEQISREKRMSHDSVCSRPSMKNDSAFEEREVHLPPWPLPAEAPSRRNRVYENLMKAWREAGFAAVPKPRSTHPRQAPSPRQVQNAYSIPINSMPVQKTTLNHLQALWGRVVPRQSPERSWGAGEVQAVYSVIRGERGGPIPQDTTGGTCGNLAVKQLVGLASPRRLEDCFWIHRRQKDGIANKKKGKTGGGGCKL